MRCFAFFASIVSFVLAASAHGGTVRVPQDFTTIQAAVDNAVNGDTIRVAQGTYPENVTVAGRSFLTLRAKGKVRVTGNASDNGIFVDNSDHIELRGLIVEGGTFRRVLLATCTDSRVTGCTMLGPAGDGILVIDSTRVRVDRNTVVGVAGYGIHVESIPLFGLVSTTGATDSDFEKNTVRDTGDSGIRMQCLNCRLTKNKVQRAGGNGIELAGTVTSTKNKVTDVDVNGIFVSAAGVSLTKDKTTGSGDDGIEVKAQNCVLVKCSASRSQDDGFQVLVESVGSSLTKCRAKRSTGDGFEVTGTSNVFTKCKTTSSGAFGLNDPAGGATTNTYTNCTFDSSNVP